MANTSSAKKAVRYQEKRRQRNTTVRSAIKTIQKEALTKLASSNPQEAKEAVTRAISQVDKALASGIVHKNKAARKKSRLMKKLNRLFEGKKAV